MKNNLLFVAFILLAITAKDSMAIADLDTPLNERVSVFDIPLSGPVSNGTTTTNTIYPAVRPGGGLTLGWNEGDLGHLTRINSNMVAEGVEWDLEGLMIVGALGLPNDGVAVLVIDHTSSMTDSFSIDRHLRLFIYDANGNKTRETSIVGGNGIEVPERWFSWGSSRTVAMVANGDRFSIFTKISRNWTEESGTHQGDLYIEVDADGNLDESTEDVWSASHSNRQHLVLGPNGEGLRLIVGDSNPYGLDYQTSAKYEDVVVWPHEEFRVEGKADNNSSVAAGDLCGFQYRDGRLFATLASGRGALFNPSTDFGDVVLLSWDYGIGKLEDEDVEISETWLTETPATAEVCPTLTAIGNDHQLIAWGSREGTLATLALLDSKGTLINGPTASTAPFYKSSIAVAMPNGNVVWTYAEDNATSVNIVVVETTSELTSIQASVPSVKENVVFFNSIENTVMVSPIVGSLNVFKTDGSKIHTQSVELGEKISLQLPKGVYVLHWMN